MLGLDSTQINEIRVCRVLSRRKKSNTHYIIIFGFIASRVQKVYRKSLLEEVE